MTLCSEHSELLSAVTTTVGTAEDARRLAQAVLELRLAACVQIEAIDSIYRWQGEVLEDGEFRLLCKTQPAQYAQLEAAIRQHHPYQLPAIHAIATVAADPAYAAWVADNAGGPAAPTSGRR